MSIIPSQINMEDTACPVFKLGYRPELDGLRGISILLVFIHHLYYPLMPGGFLGVDMFFVLSGFLITSLLIEEWERHGSINLKNFYIRRAFRLMPAVFLIILSLALYAIFFLDAATADKTYQGIWLTLSYTSNWIYSFDFASADNPLGVTWSLSIEEQFYLLFPLLLTLAFRHGLRRSSVIQMLALSIAVITLNRLFLAETGASIPRLYYASDTRADALLIGCLAACVVSWGILSHKRFGIFFNAFAVFGFGFLCFMAAKASWLDMFLYQGGYILVDLSVVSLLIVLVVYKPRIPAIILSFSPLVWIGRISYGLYLWHWSVRYFVYQGKALPSSNLQLIAAIGLSFLLTICSFYCFEKPFLQLKNRYGNEKRSLALEFNQSEMTTP